jgi:hypothetical protein
MHSSSIIAHRPVPIAQAKDLDALIDAHNRYLDSMLDGCLLGRCAGPSGARPALN